MAVFRSRFASLFVAALVVLAACADDKPFQQGPLLTPSELVTRGFEQSRVVMINDVHDGPKRLVRARTTITGVLAGAHDAGVRFLAMEALTPAFAEEANRTRGVPPSPSRDSYLAQPEMRDLIDEALGLGMTLVAYEADPDVELPAELQSKQPSDPAYIDWRERTQADHLAHFLSSQPTDTRLLVVPGDSHLSKAATDEFTPMAVYFTRAANVTPFSIDQAVTSDLAPAAPTADLSADTAATLNSRPNHVGGFLRSEDPNPARRDRTDVDAFILSIDGNALE